MRYLLLIVLACSMSARGMPITWTIEGGAANCDWGPGPGEQFVECLFGSFVFDPATVTYSDIDLTYGNGFSGAGGVVYRPVIESMPGVQIAGDRFSLRLIGEDVAFVLDNYDLSNEASQSFDWAIYRRLFPGIDGGGSGILVPEQDPMPAPVPATLPLIGLALAGLGWSRTRSSRYAQYIAGIKR